jgi:hypothetical protein
MNDESGHHSEHCHCFECFCAKQVRRVSKGMWTRQDKRRRAKRAKALAEATDRPRMSEIDGDDGDSTLTLRRSGLALGSASSFTWEVQNG